MKFNKSLRNEIAETLPEWEGEFISYKKLKQNLRLIDAWQKECIRSTERSRMDAEDCLSSSIEKNLKNPNCRLTEENVFVHLLDHELVKISTFFLEKEEECIIRLKELKERVAKMDESGDTMQVKKDILDFHGEMVLLLHYSVLNFAGLLKIVKKHNKKTGIFIELLSMPGVLQQPFFITDNLYKLLKESEAILNQLMSANQP